MNQMGTDLQKVMQSGEESRQQLTEAQVKWILDWKPPENIAAGERHTLVCGWCKKPFEAEVKSSGRFRNSIEYEPLQRLLHAPPAWEPPICDNCFPSVMGSARAHNNSADNPEKITNFLLRMQELERKAT